VPFVQANVICIVYSVEDFTSVEKVLFMFYLVVKQVHEVDLRIIINDWSVLSIAIFIKFLSVLP